jgi:hypothetical protein
MTRRSSTSTSTSTRPIRQRRSGAPTRRVAGGQLFTTLGFSLFRLVPSFDREPGEPPYAVLRLREARTAMAAFAAMS